MPTGSQELHGEAIGVLSAVVAQLFALLGTVAPVRKFELAVVGVLVEANSMAEARARVQGPDVDGTVAKHKTVDAVADLGW